MARLYKRNNLEIPHKIDTVALPRPELGPCESLGEWASRLNRVPLVLQPGQKFEYSTSTDMGWMEKFQSSLWSAYVRAAVG